MNKPNVTLEQYEDERWNVVVDHIIMGEVYIDRSKLDHCTYSPDVASWRLEAKDKDLMMSLLKKFYS